MIYPFVKGVINPDWRFQAKLDSTLGRINSYRGLEAVTSKQLLLLIKVNKSEKFVINIALLLVIGLFISSLWTYHFFYDLSNCGHQLIIGTEVNHGALISWTHKEKFYEKVMETHGNKGKNSQMLTEECKYCLKIETAWKSSNSDRFQFVEKVCSTEDYSRRPDCGKTGETWY